MSSQGQWQQFGNAAEMYERYMVPGIFRYWTSQIIKLAALKQGERALDVGCGSGVVVRAAAPAVGSSGRVVGLDISPGMIAVARALPPPDGAKIEWHEASATAMPLPDADFDVEFAQQVIQFIPDRAAALSEMYRMLADGGRVIIVCWTALDRCPGYVALANSLEQRISAAAAGFIRNGIFGLSDGEQLAALVSGAGFKDVEVRTLSGHTEFTSAGEFVQGMAEGTALAQFVDNSDVATIAAVSADVSAALQAYPRNGGEFPITTNVALARK